MRKPLSFWWAVLPAIAACDGAPGPAALMAADPQWSLAGYAKSMEAALGVFNDIPVFERSGDSWTLLSGQYIPITVGGKAPTKYSPDMKSDRPMMLPTVVQDSGVHGLGQSNPYSVVGRMPGSNPEVQWVFVVRQYTIKTPAQDSFPYSPDIAVIGHHPRTGATAFLQYYAPKQPKLAQVVLSPWSAGAEDFWSPMDSLIPSFRCERCHNAGPFIHTPWINQATVGRGAAVQPVVPSNPLGPLFYVASGPGEMFESWDAALVVAKGGGHLADRRNACTACHRMAPNLLGLHENSTRYAGLTDAQRNALSVRSDSFQTAAFDSLYWMPPVDPRQIDFYAGQASFKPNWKASFEASAALVNQVMRDSVGSASWREGAIARGLAADVPRPPKQYQTILVDRPGRDTIAPRQTLWILDSRMRANTDGTLSEWQFTGSAAAGGTVTVAPVVYRRLAGGNSITLTVVFVGTPRSLSGANQLLPVLDNDTFDMQLGDYLGIVFTNTGNAAATASIPYSDDDWAKLYNADSSLNLLDGYVTYRLVSSATPRVGASLLFQDAAFRTYSFEFRNRL